MMKPVMKIGRKRNGSTAKKLNRVKMDTTTLIRLSSLTREEMLVDGLAGSVER